MNKTEQKTMDRLVQALESVPGISGHGSNSVTVAALAAYQRDMEKVKGLALSILRPLAYPDSFDVDDVSDSLHRLERFIEARKQEQWCDRSTAWYI